MDQYEKLMVAYKAECELVGRLKYLLNSVKNELRKHDNAGFDAAAIYRALARSMEGLE